MRGIIPDPRCSLPVKVGKVKCVLTDKFGNYSRQLEITAFLANTNMVPFLIGMKGLIDEGKVWIDLVKREGHIEV